MLEQFMECIDYAPTEGTKYCWKCFGSNAYTIDYWNDSFGETGVSVQCVFDVKDNTVYEMQAWDYKNDRQYRWIHPDYANEYREEALGRGVNADQSYDDNKFIDLELESDMLEKASAIFSGKEYDHRIMITLDFTNDEKITLMELAHEADMSLNQYIEYILQKEIDRLQEKK